MLVKSPVFHGFTLKKLHFLKQTYYFVNLTINPLAV